MLQPISADNILQASSGPIINNVSVNVNATGGNAEGSSADTRLYVFEGSDCNILACSNCGKPKFTHHDLDTWACPRTQYLHSGVLFGGPCRHCSKHKREHINPSVPATPLHTFI